MENFISISYKLHKTGYSLDKNNQLSLLQKSWLRTDTVDYWRHLQMIKPIMPIAKLSPGSSWITIGDGRLGLDSIRLKSIEESLDIMPTDISTILLDKAKRIGLIEKYSFENAENITSNDNSFDYCFCKESFHHFPRPYIALYEMLRISRKAVILIEPADDYKKPLPFSLIETIKLVIKKIIGKQIKHPDFFRFEDSGNYVYTLSSRDVEKVAAGMNLPMIGYKYFNDYYEEGVSIALANNHSLLFKKVKLKIKLRNFLCKIGLETYSGVIAVIFNKLPERELIISLEKNGFTMVAMPKNPYLKE